MGVFIGCLNLFNLNYFKRCLFLDILYKFNVYSFREFVVIFKIMKNED